MVKRNLLYIMMAVLLVVAVSGASEADIIGWGGDIAKSAITYYTYDGSSYVANTVSLAKPKGVSTPNTVLFTRDWTWPAALEDRTIQPTPVPLVDMSIISDVNGKFFLHAKGDQLPGSRGLMGHAEGYGILILNDNLTYDFANDTFAGSGSALIFNAAVDVTATATSKKGVLTGAGRLAVHPIFPALMVFSNSSSVTATATRVVMKPFSVRYAGLSITDTAPDYTTYAGDWNYSYTMTSASDPANPDIGVQVPGTLTLNVDADGYASLDVHGSSCSTTYRGVMEGETMTLYSANESSPSGSSCNGNGSLVVTFTNTTSVTGNTATYGTDGSWVDGTVTLTR